MSLHCYNVIKSTGIAYTSHTRHPPIIHSFDYLFCHPFVVLFVSWFVRRFSICSCVCASVLSFVCSFIHFVYWFVFSVFYIVFVTLARIFFRPPVHSSYSFYCLLVFFPHSFTLFCTFLRLFIYSSIRSFVRSFVQSLVC